LALLKDILAENLNKFSRARGLSQKDLAKALNVSFQTVNAYMNARQGVSSDMLARFATALGVEESELTSDPKGSPHSIADCVRVVSEAALSSSGPPLDSLDRRALAALATVDDPEVKAWLVDRLAHAADVASKPIGSHDPDENDEESG
jgi:transcriptional regulator with XRE-family HTH domain